LRGRIQPVRNLFNKVCEKNYKVNIKCDIFLNIFIGHVYLATGLWAQGSQSGVNQNIALL
jgi:hypothetical protein